MDFNASDEEVDGIISEILSETQWSQEKQSLFDFMSEFTSAQPVRIISQGGDVDLSPADVLYPFLAFSRRRRTKVYAENLVWDDKEMKYVRKGPILEIPKDYLGWFEVEHEGWKPNHSCHSSIGDVAKTKCKTFLVRTTVICHLNADNNNDGEFQVGPETRIHPGEILNVIDVITKKWKTKSVGAATDNKTKGELSTKFLQCSDRQERRVFLSFAHPGEFYPLWNSDMKSKAPKSDYAYYIHGLLSYGFPLRVRVVFGWPPTDFPEFSGLLQLLGVSRPDTLVLRNLKPDHCVITEIPIDCYVQIERIKGGVVSSLAKSFEKLLAHSCDRIYPYLIGMKHMDRRYPVLPSATDEDTSALSNENKKMCRMARPRDMTHFDTMDIFPPLQEPIRQMADSWTLSFRDPGFASGEADLRDAESVIVDPENTAVISHDRLSSVSGSLHKEMKGMDITDQPIPRREQMLQGGAQREHVLVEREADC